MNTLWLKIASGVIGILIVIVIVTMLLPGGEKEPETTQPPVEKQQPTNFYDQANKDKEELTVKENYADNPEEQTQSSIEPNQSENNAVAKPVEAQPVPLQQQPTEVTIYVKQLNEAERTQAEEQLNWGVTSFSIGRLPATSYKASVDAARRIISRWPESIYSFNAKLMLAKIPERYQQQYKITPEELDTSIFYQTRAGTIPVKVKIEDHS